MRRLSLRVRPGEYTVARLAADADVPTDLLRYITHHPPPTIPAEAPGEHLVSVTRTGDELSVVCPSELWHGSDPGKQESGWRVLSVRGPLEFTLTGIIAAISSELAAAGVGLFTLSTYDTDHVLVKDTDLSRAVAALRVSGHEVTTGPTMTG